MERGTNSFSSPGQWRLFNVILPVLIQDVPPDFIRSPDDAKVKPKMLFASSRDAIRRSLDGIALEIQGTDPTEVSYETSLLAFLECDAIC